APLSDKAFAFLNRQGSYMLEPYQLVPDFHEKALAWDEYQAAATLRKEQEEAQAAKAELEKQQALEAGKKVMNELLAAGTNILQAWKAAGCQHPAPATVVEAKNASGLNWKNFINSL